MVDYEKIMCCDCKSCVGKKIIEYEYGNCKITRCENFYPKYEFKDNLEEDYTFLYGDD